MPVALTALNSMLDTDFARALERFRTLGMRHVDLKDAIFGKPVTGLSDEEAEAAAALVVEHGLSIYCLSTMIFDADVEIGESAFIARYAADLDRIAAIARRLQPQLIRLIAAKSSDRHGFADSVSYLAARHDWVIPVYRRAVDRLSADGFGVTIENESDRCLLASAKEVDGFFDLLGRRDAVSFTWDVVNMWECGTAPSLDVYAGLRERVGYYHVKGSRIDPGPDGTRWKSSLAASTWPVAEITRRVAADGTSPVICLNPPHGRTPDDFDAAAALEADLSFVRALLDEASPAP